VNLVDTETWTPKRLLVVCMLIGALVVQLVIGYEVLSGDASLVIGWLTGLYVVALLLVGYVTGLLQRPLFLAVFCGGWAVGMVGTAFETEVPEYGVFAVFLGLATVFFLYAHVVGGPAVDEPELPEP